RLGVPSIFHQPATPVVPSRPRALGFLPSFGSLVTPPPLVDITIIGGGPTGLFGLFYAGMRGVSAQIVDALPALGGQLTALYPEKYIFDVGGLPKVLAKDLVRSLAEQAAQFKQPVHLLHKVL